MGQKRVLKNEGAKGGGAETKPMSSAKMPTITTQRQGKLINLLTGRPQSIKSKATLTQSAQRDACEKAMTKTVLTNPAPAATKGFLSIGLEAAWLRAFRADAVDFFS